VHPLSDDEESEKCHLGAVIVRDLSIVVSNYRSVMTLDQYCKKHNVLGISGIDTRALTKVRTPAGTCLGLDTYQASLEVAVSVAGAAAQLLGRKSVE
jgi:carbamoyl-phosphate synthase small subunit